ncbi:MAG: efflux RND transporter periplasmic adaptor subunit [Tissierellales bacterium]|jgi:RND family efflux transporter MFP subunit|nr:efflux RND transporter periplasmic adaptor subunit [Tissierellales bacterium]
MRGKKNYLILGVISVAILISVFGCKKGVNEEKIDDTTPVEVITTESSELTECLYNIGTVEAKNIKKLSFKNSGRIEKINVEVGDYVKNGQILATLTSKEMNYATDSARAQLASAKESYILAKDALDKAQALFDTGSISKRSYDEVKTKYEVASNSYKKAQEGYNIQNNMKQENKLVANAEGYVVEVLYEEDEMINQGMPIIVVRSDSKIINIGMTQDEVDYVKMGMAVDLSFGDDHYEGNVTNIGEVADLETRTFEIEVSFDAPDIRLGSIGKTKMEIQKYQGMVLPIDTILNQGNDFVYVVEDGVVVKKNIELGTIYGDTVEVKGIENGEFVVTSNTNKIKAGDSVKVVEN